MPDPSKTREGRRGGASLLIEILSGIRVIEKARTDKSLAWIPTARALRVGLPQRAFCLVNPKGLPSGLFTV
jgi:hypothetical protein